MTPALRPTTTATEATVRANHRSRFAGTFTAADAGRSDPRATLHRSSVLASRTESASAHAPGSVCDTSEWSRPRGQRGSARASAELIARTDPTRCLKSIPATTSIQEAVAVPNATTSQTPKCQATPTDAPTKTEPATTTMVRTSGRGSDGGSFDTNAFPEVGPNERIVGCPRQYWGQTDPRAYTERHRAEPKTDREIRRC